VPRTCHPLLQNSNLHGYFLTPLLGAKAKPRIHELIWTNGGVGLSEFRNLTRAPIHEAVIDVRVKARPDLAVGDLHALSQLVSQQFPVEESLLTMQAGVQFGPGGNASARVTGSGQKGFLRKTVDQKLVLQFRVDGLSVNRLHPYSSFEDLLEVFAAHWSEYVRIARPAEVTRLAVRYINRFMVPHSGVLSDYILNAPGNIDGAHIAAFTQRTVHVFEDSSDIVNLVTALEAQDGVGTPMMMVDIDAHRSGGFGMSVQSISGALNELRVVKNHIFFAVVGPKALESFL
jgi:uncharacterized protein (TIGR04255 family)